MYTGRKWKVKFGARKETDRFRTFNEPEIIIEAPSIDGAIDSAVRKINEGADEDGRWFKADIIEIEEIL